MYSFQSVWNEFKNGKVFEGLGEKFDKKFSSPCGAVGEVPTWFGE
ncbi:hypothetical protein [Brachyspira pulli]